MRGEQELRRRIRAAVRDESEAGPDYLETAALARRLGHHVVADAFEDAAADEARHDRTFSRLLGGALR